MDARSASLADAFLGGGTDPASTQTRPLDRIHKIQRAGDDRGNETYSLHLQLYRSGAVDGHHVDVGGRRDGFLDARQRGRKGGTSRTRCSLRMGHPDKTQEST